MPERRRPTLSLTARMITGLAALLVVGALVLAFAALAYGRIAARDAFDRLLVGAANDIAASVSVEGGAPVVDLPVSAFELLALAPDDRVTWQVLGPDGAVLTGYDDLPAFPESAADTAFVDAPFKGEPARFIRVTRRFAERNLSDIVEVIVGQTLRARDELALSLVRNALIGLAAGSLVLIGLMVLVVRSALRPLDRLAGEIALRDPQDLTPLDSHVPRELATAVAAMNRFMARIDRQVGAMKSLISDTAHQLRTPVAALRAQADLAQQEPDGARRDRLVARIHHRSVSLGRLLDQMLSRALVIHRTDNVRRETVDLREIALDIFEAGDHRWIAPDTEVRLEIGDSPALVRADAPSLTEAVKNLLSNALYHGVSPVAIGADHDRTHARIWVRDAGPGPSAELRARLGERFVQSAAAGGESAGLGLSIARSVAEAFGGRFTLDTTAEGFRAGLAFDLYEKVPE